MNKETDDDGLGHGICEFLEAWHGNRELSEERRQYWIDRLRHEADLRRLAAAEIHLAGLTRAVQAGEPRWLRIEESLFGAMGDELHADLDFESDVMAAVGRRRMGFARPWLAAAAGLVIGLFGASVVWAIANPKAVATASRLFTLADGGFERSDGRMASGFPSEFGVWSGDRAEIAESAAVEGRRALRFVQAGREPALPNDGAASCDVYQLVDLRSLKADAVGSETTLELSALVRDARVMPGVRLKFIARLYVFSGSPDALPAEWPLSQKDALSSGSSSFDTVGGAPQSWQPLTTKVLMPPKADFAVVHLVLHQPKTPPDAVATFGEQFADDVRLTVKTQPTLPVRLAQR